jgi:hypothetical protein
MVSDELVSLGRRGSRWMGEVICLEAFSTHVDGCRLASLSVIPWEKGQCKIVLHTGRQSHLRVAFVFTP